MSSLEIVGILSALVTLSCFILNQYRWVSTDDVRYDLANGIAAIGLMSYAYSIGAIPFIITNSVWAIISFLDVARYIYKRSKKKRRK